MKCYLLLIFTGISVLEINSQVSHYFNRALFVRYFHSQPEVCINDGCIRGKYERGLEKPYEAFYGIPYAAPPVGILRFENPQPHAGWSGIWDASHPKDGCLQRNVYIASQPIEGSEDCLYLNVYRPLQRKSNKLLPVMVFIHGGGWFTFSVKPSLFGPEYIMDNGGAILVTIDSRLGILGFLCSGDEVVKGNFGLKDQQMALKWVANNIEAFGGDPKSVTLVGESSGAASAQLHLINPVSQAFFQRIVLISGSALASWVIYKYDYETRFRSEAKYSGYENWETASTFEIAFYMKKLDMQNFIYGLDRMFVFYEIPPVPVRPCIEGNWEGAFLTRDPEEIWAEGKFHQKPMLITSVRDEGILAVPITTNSTLLSEFNQHIHELLSLQLDVQPKDIPDVLKFYFGDKDYLDETNFKNYYKLFGDKILDYPIIRSLNEYLTYADLDLNPVYLIEFAFESSVTYAKVITGEDVNLGVGHADDLFFLFTMSDFFPPFKAHTLERKMTDIYVETFVYFATNGRGKVWRSFKPCTAASKNPSCERQVFSRVKVPGQAQDEIAVSISNQIDVKMVDFWNKIDDNV